MENGVFTGEKIEFIFEIFFLEFVEKNNLLFLTKSLEEKFDELFSNPVLNKEFTQYVFAKIYLLVYTEEEAKKVREQFMGRFN